MSPLHFLVCDRAGRAAVVEFLGGRCVVHTGPELAPEALTNDTYDSCLEYLAADRALDWEARADHTTYRSKDRFLKIARRLEEFQGERPGPAREYAFDLLSALSVERIRGQCTAWSIVYDLSGLEVSFKTHENRRVRTVRLKDFDFAPETPALALELGREIEGDVRNHFIECTSAVNARQVERIFVLWAEAGFLRALPRSLLVFLANYPQTLKIAR